MFDYDKGILSLLESELFGAAFALVRTVVEAMVRAHVTATGSEEDLGSTQKDEYKVNFRDFRDIGPEIDAAFNFQGLVENFLNVETRNALHSYAFGTSPTRKAFRGERD